ncbi:MAG: family peptidase [Sphingomonadales bacterium]|nr:family peptidase [Sphingomonadales bacterium]
MVDVRETLDRLIRERGEDYVSLSRLIGRNAAYVQQYIRRGVPKKLDEDDRRTLSRYFGVEEAVLGGPEVAQITPATARTRGGSGLIAIPKIAAQASAGPGSLHDSDSVSGQIGFDPKWLRTVTANPGSVSVIQVEGDSMVPTLADGDDILVDRSDSADRLRDGIYVLRIDDALNVKRLAINPMSRTVTIKSDNAAYPSWPDCDLSKIELIGRVVWVGRKLR